MIILIHLIISIIVKVLENVIPDLITKRWNWIDKKKKHVIKKLKERKHD